MKTDRLLSAIVCLNIHSSEDVQLSWKFRSPFGASLNELSNWYVDARPRSVNRARFVHRKSGRTYFGRILRQNMPILVCPGPNPCWLSTSVVDDVGVVVPSKVLCNFWRAVFRILATCRVFSAAVRPSLESMTY